MEPIDDIAQANQTLWENEVAKKGGYTQPWLDLDRELLNDWLNGRLHSIPYPLYELYPASFMQNAAGKKVLCLAAGGGQQSAVFGLLGAHITVADLTQGQLDGDETAAAHYGYPITTIQADMRDLSTLPRHAYDLVFQADSLAYVPDVGEVYAQVSQVLRTGGLYRVKHSQPAVHRIAWNGTAYEIAAPYAETIQHRSDGAIEFRHHMDNIVNGLLDNGFSIQRVHESPYAQQTHILNQATPGSWDHEMRYVAGGFVIIAQKSI
ncbi:class I SAM-dependent methyltransferase [Candidatus Leptofilum sp.]|uniref:class I SAM-dependent methyltransferase n=1 Tax=Candidatus Leptofilum sp. TaxID=3241576 RepID=UPI003B5947CB